MRLSVDALTDVVYSHYPRGVASDDQHYRRTPEHQRLMAARRTAAEQRDPWRALLNRFRARFPEYEVQDQALSCPAEALDACYSCRVSLPTSPDDGHHGVMLSFLVPFYAIYSVAYVPDPAPSERPPPDTVDVYAGDTMYVIPANALSPEQWKSVREEGEATERHRLESIESESPQIAKILADLKNAPRIRREISFDWSPDEQPHLAWLGREMEATFGHQRVPPEVGNVLVTDVETNFRVFGEATFYDCLFSDRR